VRPRIAIGTCVVATATFLIAGILRIQKTQFDRETAAVVELEDQLGSPVHVERFTGVPPYKHIDRIQLTSRSYTDDEFLAVVVCLESLPHCHAVEIPESQFVMTQDRIKDLKALLPRNVRLTGRSKYIDRHGEHPPNWRRENRGAYD